MQKERCNRHGVQCNVQQTQRLLRLPLPHAVSRNIACKRHCIALHWPTALSTQRLRTHCDCSLYVCRQLLQLKEAEMDELRSTIEQQASVRPPARPL